MKKGKWEKGNKVIWLNPKTGKEGRYEIVEKLTSRDVDSIWKIKGSDGEFLEVIQKELKSEGLGYERSKP